MDFYERMMFLDERVQRVMLREKARRLIATVKKFLQSKEPDRAVSGYIALGHTRRLHTESVGRALVITREDTRHG